MVLATAASPGSAETLAAEPWEGGSLLAGMVRRLADLEFVVLVVRDESHLDLVAPAPNLAVIVDPEWEEGAAAGLRVGLDWLTISTDAAAAFVATVDVPDIEPAVLRKLVVALSETDAPVAVPKYRYARGGPVLLDRSIWPRFLGAEGDVDIEQILLAHPQWVTEVRVDHAPPRHIVDLSDLLDVTG